MIATAHISAIIDRLIVFVMRCLYVPASNTRFCGLIQVCNQMASRSVQPFL